jgi:hypothetical protein
LPFIGSQLPVIGQQLPVNENRLPVIGIQMPVTGFPLPPTALERLLSGKLTEVRRNRMPYDVFLSHAGADKPAVERLAKLPSSRGPHSKRKPGFQSAGL